MASTPSSLPRIPEILKVVCDHLVEEKRTLARLARTCKDFEEPALSVLWYELEEFYPLAACLPSHLINEEDNGGEITLRLSQPLTSIDSCERLFFYSRRIRKYSDYSTGSGVKKCVEKAVYEALQLVTQGAKILPNVRQLAWKCDDEIFPFIHMFMGPHLVKVLLFFSPESLTQLSLLSVLHERHPSLTDVQFNYITDKGSVENRIKAVQLISSFVYKWENLRTLIVPRLTYSTLCKLSKLPRLHTLTMSACKFDADAMRQTTQTKGGFPALTYLLLQQCYNSSDCIAVLKLMDCSPISHLLVTFLGIEKSETYKEVFQTVAEHCQRAKLGLLEVKDGTRRDNSTTALTVRSQMITFEALKPLLVFRELRCITIELTRGIDISDATMVQEMFSSWPKLYELILIPRPFVRYPKPLITLQDIICVASRCSELEVLGLEFDASSPPEVDDDNTNSIKVIATELEELVVGDSPIKNPTLVAALLSGVFPSLSVIKTIEDQEEALQARNGNHGPAHKAWKKAEKSLKIISAVRRQERFYAKFQEEAEGTQTDKE